MDQMEIDMQGAEGPNGAGEHHIPPDVEHIDNVSAVGLCMCCGCANILSVHHRVLSKHITRHTPRHTPQQMHIFLPHGTVQEDPNRGDPSTYVYVRSDWAVHISVPPQYTGAPPPQVPLAPHELPVELPAFDGQPDPLPRKLVQDGVVVVQQSHVAIHEHAIRHFSTIRSLTIDPTTKDFPRQPENCAPLLPPDRLAKLSHLIKSLVNLQELRFHGTFDAKEVLQLVVGIDWENHKQLRVLELPCSEVTAQGMMSILPADRHIELCLHMSMCTNIIVVCVAVYGACISICRHPPPSQPPCLHSTPGEYIANPEPSGQQPA